MKKCLLIKGNIESCCLFLKKKKTCCFLSKTHKKKTSTTKSPAETDIENENFSDGNDEAENQIAKRRKSKYLSVTQIFEFVQKDDNNVYYKCLHCVSKMQKNYKKNFSIC